MCKVRLFYFCTIYVDHTWTCYERAYKFKCSAFEFQVIIYVLIDITCHVLDTERHLDRTTRRLKNNDSIHIGIKTAILYPSVIVF